MNRFLPWIRNSSILARGRINMANNKLSSTILKALIALGLFSSAFIIVYIFYFLYIIFFME